MENQFNSSRQRRALPARMAPVVLALFLLGLAGCATHAPKFAVEINALSSVPAAAETDSPTRYILLPSDPSQDPRDLQHREFEEVLELALAGKELERVDDAASADIAILMEYGIGERLTETVSYNAPYHVLNDRRFYGRRGYYGRRGRGRGRGRGGFYRPYASFSSFDRYAFSQRTQTLTTVNRFLKLEAREVVAGSDPRTGDPLWSTEARSRGSIDDLRRIFPVLVGAAAEHLATDSGQVIETTIAEDDERVIQLRPMFDPSGEALLEDPASASESSAAPSADSL